MASVVLRMYRGDGRAWSMTLTKDGDPLDLTDAEDVRFTAVRAVNGEAVISLTLGAGVDIANPSAGQIVVTLASADTEDMTVGGEYLRLFWDVEVTDGSGDRRTWPEDEDGRPRLGRLLVYADVSRTVPA